MIKGAVGILCVVLLSTGCSQRPFATWYVKGLPRSVAVEKKASRPEARFRAYVDGPTIRLVAQRRVRVRVQRQVERNTFALNFRGKWYWEWVETLLGLGMVVVMPMIELGMPSSKNTGPELSREFNSGMYSWTIDPTVTLLGAEGKGEILEEDRFPSRPTVNHYAVNLPMSGAELRYRVVGANREILAEGNVIASRLGEVTLPNVPRLQRAVAVEITFRRDTRLILLEREASVESSTLLRGRTNGPGSAAAAVAPAGRQVSPRSPR